MNRSLLLAGLLVLALLVGCGEGANSPRDIETEINTLLLAGETQRAQQLCREALREDPENPTLRALYGEIHMAAGNGQYAVIAFRQAVELGADAARMHVRIARALLLDEAYRDILDLATPDTVTSEAMQSEMAVIRLQAELGLTGDRDSSLRHTARDLIKFLDTRGTSQSWVRPLQDELMALSATNSLLASAFTHARCSQLPVEAYSAGTTAYSPETGRPVIHVGANRSIKTPAAAAAIAPDGAVILIDADYYPGAVALWPQDELTIIGVGERPHIAAAGKAIQDRDIWLFSGDDIVVENIEFSGARSDKYQNGAGLRHTGSNLTVRHSYFHDGENGILTWKAPIGKIVIEFSEFARNGYGDGQSHNVYVGETERLIFRYNYSHASKEGHLLKSRARINDISYNRLTGEEGEVSYVIDLPNGGLASIVGNEIEKGMASRNPYAITFGQEGLGPGENRLVVASNSFYNRYDQTTFIRNASETSALVANNLFGGAPAGLVSGAHEARGNQILTDHGMVDPRQYDFSLKDSASAIDAAIAVQRDVADLPIVPLAEYVHPVSMRPRVPVAVPDVGAHEYCVRSASK